MADCEVLPLAPDTTVERGRRMWTEPVEVGSYLQGTVFVKIIHSTGSASLDVEVAISPYGYEEAEHWAVGETESGLTAEKMYSIPVEHFGNVLRLALEVDGDSGAVVEIQAWFVGKG